MSEQPDHLDDLLAAPSTTASLTLRARIGETTIRQLHRRVALRKFSQVVALVVCYVAGGATVWWARPAPEPQVIVEQLPEGSKSPAPPMRLVSPHDLELAAEQADGAASAKLFLDAGRAYGNYLNDWSAALRCYRNALELDPELVRQPDPTTDDWLLVKLKTDWRDRDANP